jgi:hypothetical protein
MGSSMYDFLDRQTDALAEPHRFLAAAMRLWVRAAREGQCRCATLADGFARIGAAEALPDFGIAMTTLDRDGAAKLSFGSVEHGIVTDDEARLLTLFDAALAGRPDQVRRLAAVLVSADAVARLATSVELVALRLSDGIFVERDR